MHRGWATKKRLVFFKLDFLGCARTEDLHGHIIPLKFEKNWVLNIHDPHGGIIEIHNPLKIREKWGPKSL